MDFSATMSGQDKAVSQAQVDSLNAILKQDGVKQNALGQDDFLKILITQLSYQDPTAPMEDKEFIAQMAQFSSLEQMNQMSTNFSKLSGTMNLNSAIGMIGKNVTIASGERVVNGLVEEVTGTENPQVLVNGKFYDFNDIQSVR
ncbi:MAG: flagellar hook assembly protein FlgD [Spirochaetales bacterium]|uniref:Basal-body rod modification protein FlgD n=1 Tax=Candidatus Thalassospirochaeta sargassi TaxID=3119039 RepID=A0AAJ1IFW3_9SPIO|nr:flagellar hook assembly protein FlgD [Spirochaetales bacterium]